MEKKPSFLELLNQLINESDYVEEEVMKVISKFANKVA